VIDFKDNGFKSRKMLMTYAVLILGTGGFVCTGVWPALAVTFPEFCAFLIGASGVYITGNAATKWLAARSARKLAAETSPSSEGSQS
jgi:hypothetical protein